jgi:L-histidine Nalpha-methyltransferase
MLHLQTIYVSVTEIFFTAIKDGRSAVSDWPNEAMPDLDIFEKDVLEGLSARPKYLLSRYFYDEKGDRLFQAIMHMPEYYPSKCEYEILETYKEHLLNIFIRECSNFSLVEFGAGDGLKTQILIAYFLKKNIDFKYVPIDISGHILEELKTSLNKTFPALKAEPLQGDYFDCLVALNARDKCRKVIMFLGSNIGNFNDEEALAFLSRIAENMNNNDLLMIGFDLKKDPFTILNAYNDPYGITKEFNLNILKRINRELGANFNIPDFDHFPTYDPQSGACKSYLISLKKQEVYIKTLNTSFLFEQWEPLFTEVSRKYDRDHIQKLADNSGLLVHQSYYDCKHFFNSVLFIKK